ncbi:phospholipid transport system transporter-binding protein [Methylophilus rhizosphaerae]|uniref:Phospholipid transport system transporter-binding protein n=1 Tax=Methylophilus rhizosphaerae TaxID=492660 RepID=A0A1G9DSI4_9PROT|nr:STAS domain-containing protein [Methylophilus rhizosphaerae]SDK66802.1 phospholipid transport system transporter-binding protein [Methylophilus rhizosphaerae]
MAHITQQQGRLSFNGHLLVNNISETLAELQGLRLEAPLTLDFTQVGEVDTVAISLILEIQRQLNHQHVHAEPVSVVGVPDNLRSLMQLYGVDKFLLN